MKKSKKKKLKILIIGYGSIGRIHAKILSKFKNTKIYILTSQKKAPYKIISNLKEILICDPDYIIISCVTTLHFKYVDFIEKNLKDKLVLVEKPLFEKHKKILCKNNKYFTGYNLRFHPIIKFIKSKFKNRTVKYINVNCSSYLPNWRNNINYTKAVSASKVKGGGVLLELSHELDYLTWIFGDLDLKYSLNKKISNLKIDTDDILLLNAIVKNKRTIIDLAINFFSRVNKREIQVESNGISIHADIINNKLIIYEKGKKQVLTWSKFKIFDTYKKEHISILKKDFVNLCSLSESLKLLKFIKKIRQR